MDLTTAPDFIGKSQDDILAEFEQNYRNAYFEITGESVVIHPAQGEKILINGGSYSIFAQCQRARSAALQNLPQFATGPVLDMLAQPFGVERLMEQSAKVTILLTLIAGHGDLVIPAQTRIQSADGLATFVIQAAIPVSAGTNTIPVVALCDTPGVSGNGYEAGSISTILDPQAYLVSAVSTDVSVDGADVESDASLRQRLFKAAARFSTAGSEDAYIFFALSASSLIIDVKPVGDPETGVVSLYVLVPGGTTPDEILTAVEVACNPKKVRPLTDIVVAVSPSIVDYAIELNITAYGSVADTDALIASIQAAIAAQAATNDSKMGIDVILSQIIAKASVNGVAKVGVVSPPADVVIGDTEASHCTGITINLTGFNYDR